MNRILTSVLVLALLTSLSFAADLFVAQKDAKADDKNAGTEALPFKTIPAAVEKSQPGDTIWVKEGNYEERVVLKKQGMSNRPFTLSAWKDDRVQIGYRPRPLPVEGEWKPVEGSKSWQIKLTADVPEDFLILLDSKAVLTWPQDGPPKDEKVNWASYRKKDRTLFYNANGKDPGKLGRFEYGRRPGYSSGGLSFLSVEPPANWWVIRKIEFSWSGVGVYLCGENTVIEDCFFTHCYRGGMFIHGRTQTVRRCNFYKCGNSMHSSGQGVAHVFEDNLIVECGLAPEDDILPVDIPNCVPEGYGSTCFKGSMYGHLFSHNIISDSNGGWYADCPGIQSCRMIGNAFWDNPGGGMYNEAMVNDSVTQANVFYRNGIGSSVATRWNLIDNLFFEGGIFWNNLDLNPIRDGYMLLRKNAFVNPPVGGYLTGYASGWGEYAWPEVFSNCIVDRNRIWQDKDGVLINDGGKKKYTTLEQVQKQFKWELNGQVLPYDKRGVTVESAAKAMGGSVVTFRIPWGKHNGDARPMLSNSGINNSWPGCVLSTDTSGMPAYFWRVADGNYRPAMAVDWASFLHENQWLQHGSGEGGALTNGCRWYLDAEAKYPKDLLDKTPCRKGQMENWWAKMAYTEGNFWMVMEGAEPDKMLPQGMGYWTPTLGAAPGAKITVSLKIRGKKLESSDKGSPVVWLQFTNETGQHRKRVFLVGKDDAGKWQGEKFTKGDFDWTEVKQTITAPDTAVRMALFLGATPCKGQINFDDIHITTASEASNVAADILLPRLPLQRFKETVLLDISKQANRKLIDETDNDGKGGWTDQGPGADMRELKTGDRRLGGVMFRIADAVVVLKSDNRNKGDLPDKVTIPVGKKLDTLFFLHTAAWMHKGNDEAFRYVIHYADGKDVTLKVTGNNLADWTADGVARFPLEEDTFTTVVETVKNSQYRQGSLYRMEWSCPLERRGVEIKSIDFETAQKKTAVPVLLGITGVVIWN